MKDLRNIIEQYIYDRVLKNGYIIKYRKPLIGFANAEDPLFKRLPEVTHEGHLMPQDLLPTAKTVISFFLPFDKEVIKTNRKIEASTEWALAYNGTNALLYELSQELKDLLASHGYLANYVEPTNNFDKIELVSQWSHKHVAYVAGLGKFGVNRQLITPVGCAGRFSSVVTDAEIKPFAQHLSNDHQHKMCEQCGWCIKNACPVNALTANKWDKQACWTKLQENEKLVGLRGAQSCGKCVVGPCSII